MATLDNLIALLNRLPIWKKLKTLPERVDALERRVGELEAQVSGGVQDVCPKCKKRTFAVTRSEPDPTFGELGATSRTYECTDPACGHSERKVVT